MPKKGSALEPIILQHAILMFGDNSYDAVSTRAIAASASTTEASIYRVFDTKDGLYQRAVKDVSQRAQQQMGQVLLHIAQLPKASPRKQIFETVRGWYDALPRPDARLLHQVLKQATTHDKKAHAQASAAIDQIINIVAGLQGRLNTKNPSKANLNAQLLIWALFQQKVIQTGTQPSKEETPKVHALIENWIDLVE